MPDYDEDYFMRGKETGRSNYSAYEWKPSLTIPMVRSLIEFLDIRPGDNVLDIGCARGFYVKALRSLGVDAYGYDTSEWAVNNCHPDVVGYVARVLHTTSRYSHVFSKDTFEHLHEGQLSILLKTLSRMFQRSMLFIVPLSIYPGEQYVRTEDNDDPSHIIRWPLEKWLDFVNECVGASDVAVMGSWHVPALKPASLSCPRSCGFILVKRV